MASNHPATIYRTTVGNARQAGMYFIPGDCNKCCLIISKSEAHIFFKSFHVQNVENYLSLLPDAFGFFL